MAATSLVGLLITALPGAAVFADEPHAGPLAPTDIARIDAHHAAPRGAGSASGGADNAGYEPIAELRQRAEAFLTAAIADAQAQRPTSETVQFEVQNPDTRLRLARCETEPEAGFGPGAGLNAVNTTIEIRCPQPAWRVYLGARIERSAMVAIVNRSLPRNHIIAAGDLRYERRTLGAQAWVTDAEPVIGQSTRRAVRAGQPLLAHQVTSPTHVRRGDRVFIVSQNPRIQIQMMGEALEDGRAGETVRVRNLSSSREISARVLGDGRVEVLL